VEGGEKLMVWSKEETELLLSMCERYALRWVVIADRWEQLFDEQAMSQRTETQEFMRKDLTEDPSAMTDGPSSAAATKESSSAEGNEMEVDDADSDRENHVRVQRRTMEELKERFYTVQKKLLAVRGPDACEPPSALVNFVYDRSKEEARKAQADKLLNRTREQLQEEEELLEILHRINANTREATSAPAANRKKRSSERKSGRKRRRGADDEDNDEDSDNGGKDDVLTPGERSVDGTLASAIASADAAADAQLPAIIRHRKHPTRPTMRSHLLLGAQLSKEQAARVQETLNKYQVPYVRTNRGKC